LIAQRLYLLIIRKRDTGADDACIVKELICFSVTLTMMLSQKTSLHIVHFASYKPNIWELLKIIKNILTKYQTSAKFSGKKW